MTHADIIARLTAATGPDARFDVYDEVLKRAERFWSFVSRADQNDCWEWQAGRGPASSRRLAYGRFYISKARVVRAHRAAWMLSHGPIPAGKFVCHSCDVPFCCNPAHLWLGSAADNNSDRDQKGRGHPPQWDSARPFRKAVGVRHGSAKLTPTEVSAIIADDRSYSKIASDYGINQTTVGRIKRGILWSQALRTQEPHHG
jgi:hypothetical protein